jgi:3-dehydroquinate dehydratase
MNACLIYYRLPTGWAYTWTVDGRELHSDVLSLRADAFEGEARERAELTADRLSYASSLPTRATVMRGADGHVAASEPTRTMRVTTRVTKIEVREYDIELPSGWPMDLDALSPEQRDDLLETLTYADHNEIMDEWVEVETVTKIEAAPRKVEGEL